MTDQMIIKGITTIEVTGIFTTALLEWNGMEWIQSIKTAQR